MTRATVIRTTLIPVLTFAFCFGATIEAWTCSTFALRGDSVVLVGHNLDETPGFYVPGLICINKRGVRKEGVAWSDLVAPPRGSNAHQTASEKSPIPKVTWVSRYGSITVNTDGLEFPDCGINEAGLVVCEMSLPSTRFPVDATKPTIFMSLWIQYQLDNYSSVEEVIDNARQFNLDGWNWHFMVADASGDCAVIEFIAGDISTYTAEDLPVPALCNAPYAVELDRLRDHEAPGGAGAVKRLFSRPSRFVRAAMMLKAYDASHHPSPLEYCWNIIEEIRIHGWNKWSILVDVMGGTLYFNTADNRAIRYLSLKGIDFSCRTPSRVLNIHAAVSGDVSGDFVDYTYERNLEFMKSRAGILFEKRLRPLMDNGLTAMSYAKRFAQYPERTSCSMSD